MRPNEISTLHEKILGSSSAELKAIREKLELSDRDLETLLIQAARETNVEAIIDCFMLIRGRYDFFDSVYWMDYAEATKKPSLRDFHKKEKSWSRYYEEADARAEPLDHKFAQDPANIYLHGPKWRTPYGPRILRFANFLKLEGWKIPTKDLVEDLFVKAPKWHKPEPLLEEAKP